MADLLGWTALLSVAACTCILAYRWPSIAVPLIVAFGVRAAAALFHVYVMPLPDGRVDAVTFERLAWEWSQGSFGDVISDFPGINSNFYPWLMSWLYAATGRSPLMLQAASVFVGTLGVFFAWRLAAELWNHRHARKVAWAMALFPTVVQYAALTMREAWVVLFFLVGLIGVLRWARSGGVRPVIGASAAFGVATFFHGGMFVVGVAFLGLVGSAALRKLVPSLSRGRLRTLSAVGFILCAGAIGGYTLGGLALPKLGTATEAVDIQRWMSRFSYQQSLEYAEARYGRWQVAERPTELLWIVPAKNVYFLFSPFPWDLRAARHIVGLADAVLYIGLAFLAWRHRRDIWRDPGSRAILLVLVAGIFAFAVGTANFGTAVRHRAKFVAALLALAAPGLPRFVVRPASHPGARGPGHGKTYAVSGSWPEVPRSSS